MVVTQTQGREILGRRERREILEIRLAMVTHSLPPKSRLGEYPSLICISRQQPCQHQLTSIRIEGHYKYVIMIVIIVVAIVGGWIAAAFFRRRYLRKRELNYEMRPPTAPWATGHSGPTGPYGGGGFGDGSGKEAAIMTTPMTAAQVKKEKKKWFVNERT